MLCGVPEQTSSTKARCSRHVQRLSRAAPCCRGDRRRTGWRSREARVARRCRCRPARGGARPRRAGRASLRTLRLDRARRRANAPRDVPHGARGSRRGGLGGGAARRDRLCAAPARAAGPAAEAVRRRSGRPRRLREGWSARAGLALPFRDAAPERLAPCARRRARGASPSPRAAAARAPTRPTRADAAAVGHAHLADRGHRDRGRRRLDLDSVRRRVLHRRRRAARRMRTSSERARPVSRSAGARRRAPTWSSSSKAAARAGTSSRAAAHPSSCPRPRAPARSARTEFARDIHDKYPRSWVRRENLPATLRDATVVFVPYCTGDVHSGDAVTTYAPPLPGRRRHHLASRRARERARLPEAARRDLPGSTEARRLRLLGGRLRLARELPGVPAVLAGREGVPRRRLRAAARRRRDPAGTREAWYARWDMGASLDGFCPECRTDLSAGLRELAARYPDDRIALVSHLHGRDDPRVLRHVRARAARPSRRWRRPASSRSCGSSARPSSIPRRRTRSTSSRTATGTRRSRTRPSSARPRRARGLARAHAHRRCELGERGGLSFRWASPVALGLVT